MGWIPFWPSRMIRSAGRMRNGPKFCSRKKALARSWGHQWLTLSWVEPGKQVTFGVEKESALYHEDVNWSGSFVAYRIFARRLTFLNPAPRDLKPLTEMFTTSPDTSPWWRCYFVVQVNSTYVYLFSWTPQTIRISISSFFPCRTRIILSQSALLEKMAGKIQSSSVYNWISAVWHLIA